MYVCMYVYIDIYIYICVCVCVVILSTYTINSRDCSKPWWSLSAKVRSQSEANVRLHDLLSKKRERETPFLEGEAWSWMMGIKVWVSG